MLRNHTFFVLCIVQAPQTCVRAAQTSTESDAVMGTAQTNTLCFHASISLDNILPRWTSRSTVARKFMSTSYQGTSGPSGYAGSGPAPIQPVSGNHATTEPALIRLEQLSQERLTSNQISKLTVRLLVGMFGLGTNGPPGDARITLKSFWNSNTRYNPVPLTECPSDWSIGVVCDEGKDRHRAGAPR